MLIEMSIKGLMIDPITNMPIVILRDADDQRVLPIWVGPVEANAIALQIENVAPPRPMTHDLLRNVLAELGASLVAGRHCGPARQHVLRVSRTAALAETHSHRCASERRARALPCGRSAGLRRFARARPRQVRGRPSEEADQERLQRWLESLDPEDLGYKM